ncbi:TetR/AcrR family transcriptional regulator [Nocardioides panacis]|uniref:TetR/AcrR family transcriptional regulator n=1 Tax=Nocardioides panacis TaxID=2849501 RepID=A0A975SXJ6_9ACTN|nr:TetR/AcrR family transcriptional regulator [Nocardioides panacis]QWZ07772.1 TetR/AcrR family transcriptional regulator [Nocardioides panacis]
MPSLRNISRATQTAPPGHRRAAGDDALLDAARASIVALGWRRSTLTDVARRAGVSRMTIYRRWPDMRSLVGDLMTREWSGIAEEPSSAGSARERLADGVAATVAALRRNELFRTIVEVDPELLLPYLLERRGRTQDALLARLEAGVVEGRADGSVRAGDPALLARSVLLAAYGFGLSTATMTGDGLDAAAFDGELRALVDGYLHP